MTRLRFRVLYRGRCLTVTVERDARRPTGSPTASRWTSGTTAAQVTVDHADLVLDIPPAPQVEPVHQPAGAAPRRRSRPESD